MQYLTQTYHYTRAALYPGHQPELIFVWPTDETAAALEGSGYTPEELAALMKDPGDTLFAYFHGPDNTLS